MANSIKLNLKKSNDFCWSTEFPLITSLWASFVYPPTMALFWGWSAPFFSPRKSELSSFHLITEQKNLCIFYLIGKYTFWVYSFLGFKDFDSPPPILSLSSYWIISYLVNESSFKNHVHWKPTFSYSLTFFWSTHSNYIGMWKKIQNIWCNAPSSG